jgi:TonB family protein
MPAQGYRPPPEIIAAPPRATDLTVYPRRSIFARLLGAIAVLVLIWAGLHFLHRPSAQGTDEATSPAPSAPEPQSQAAAAPLQPLSKPPSQPPTAPPVTAAGIPAGVAHQELPVVPRSASDTIRGRFHVVVRVTVNRSGNVVDESLDDPGPSQYFAKLASKAARQWRFAADSQDARQWLVRFDFSRDETTAEVQAAPLP